ncbi:MAG: glycosyltransferase family 4 protein [Victivallaceae bacterium]|jgi:glycosyltransferase involved in cell wall biosynthesis
MTEQDPRKICIILKEFPVSEEPGLSDQIELLEQMGNFLHIIVLRDTEHSNICRINADIKFLDFSPVRLLQGLGTLVLMLIITPVNSIKAFCLMLKLLICTCHPLKILKSYLQAVLAVNEDIIPLEITHIHSEAFPETARVAVFASVLSGLKVSFTVLPINIYGCKSRETALLLSRGNFILTLSAYDRNHLSEDIFKSKSRKPAVVSLPPGVNLNNFTFNKKMNIPREPFKLITIGALKKKKGIHTILQALKLLKERGMGFTYRIIGEGEERDNLEALATSLGLDDAVIFRGNLSRQKTINELRVSDLFVIASEITPDGDRDSIPMAILESMALGVPVVATRITGIQEVIEDEETGILVPPSDPAQLADACESMLKDPENRQLIIVKARLFVEGSCDLLIQTRRLSEFLQESGMI